MDATAEDLKIRLKKCYATPSDNKGNWGYVNKNMDATILNNCIINNSHEYSDDPLQYILFDESVSSGVVWSDAYAATSGQTNIEIVVIKKLIWNPLKAHRIL